MKIELTDINVALCIIQNISKSERGDGKLTIDLFNNSCIVTINYNGDELKARTISIESPHAVTKEWIGGEIAFEEIEKHLRAITQEG